jgi:hypothetical protein
MQEDEAQLLLAILQATRSAVSLVNRTHSPTVESSEQPESLRIQMGRRVVYGQLAHGQFRNELDADRMKAVFDALQRPVTPGVDPETYRGKVPAIEISEGKTVLFREERDGTVTVNQIQFQLEQRAAQTKNQIAAAQNGHLEAKSDLTTPTTGHDEAILLQRRSANALDAEWKANDLAQVAEYLLNPLGDEAPLYDAVSIQGYQISQTGDSWKVTKGNALVLHASNGRVLEHNISQADWEAFQGMMIRPVSWNAQQLPQVDAVSQDPINSSANQNGGISFTHPAIAAAERQIARLPEGLTKKLLTATVQDWKQQISQGFQQGVVWLASLPETWRNHQVAHAALDLFQRGYERTGEKSYQAGDYTISLRGQNLYALSDHSGELMRFKTSKPLLYRHCVQMVSISDRLGDSHRKHLQKMQRNGLFMPHGSLGIETVYTAKTSRVEQTVKDFLTNHVGANVWNKEGGRFKLEMRDDFLRITDKQGGRGTIFQRKDGKVFSRLGSGDFKHFERLATRMQRMEQPKTSTAPRQQSSLEIE